jgi:nucleotide-binding universal stress UspA family protein
MGGGIDSVVLATDFSPGAERAARRVALLPLAPGASVSVVHVLGEAAPPGLADAVRERATEALRAVAATLRRSAEAHGASAIQLECALLSGSPPVEIVRHARAAAAGLIVLGRHGPRPFREALVGSTAERVVRKADAPVLLVAGEATDPYRRALVAVDLADGSRRAAELAVALLPPDGAELALVHAYHLAFEGWLAETDAAAYRRAHAEEAERRLEAFAARLEAAGIRCAVEEGDPRAVILREAARTRAELIVLGTHARSGVAHALLGSVAEGVMRAAPGDVAVTRPPRFAFELP